MTIRLFILFLGVNRCSYSLYFYFFNSIYRRGKLTMETSQLSDNSVIETAPAKDKMPLVSPLELAYRLAYLLLNHRDNNAKKLFFQVTRKSLEKLAKESNAIHTTITDDIIKDKAPISEAYIDCVRYELEKLGFLLIKADKKYLLCAASTLSRVSSLTKDYEQFNTINTLQIKQKVHEGLKPTDDQKKQSKAKDKNKVTEDKQLILEDIWSVLLQRAGQSLTPEKITLTHKKLTKCCTYQLHQNGLASYLYSIAQYCQSKQLPRLDYLVVKEGTGFPEGILATDIEAIKDFHDQLEQVITFVKESDNSFPSKPLDLKFEKKPKAKKSTDKKTDHSPL